MTDRYCVFGNPVAHSWSPRIHAAFARQTGEDIQYDRQEVALDEFAGTARAFFAAGGCGLNITLPFKQEAARFADEASPLVLSCGAANTLWREGTRILAENTDGTGLVRDLERNLGTPLAGARILVLGAGGAVRGALPALLQAGCASLHIANRTPVKAERLAARFSNDTIISASGLDTLAGLGAFDLLVNAISAGLHGEMPDLPESLVADGATCYDMIYAAQPTPFLRWAIATGRAQCADGLGMLVEQAAESFRIWRGKAPHTAPVIAMMRSELQVGP